MSKNWNYAKFVADTNAMGGPEKYIEKIESEWLKKGIEEEKKK